MATEEQTRNYRRLGNAPIIPVPNADIKTPKELDNFYRTEQNINFPPDIEERLETVENEVGVISVIGNKFVATGAIENGDVVALRTDGTVETIGVSNTLNISNGITFTAGNGNSIASTYDSTNNKIIYFYTNSSNSNYGTARIGTVSGDSITFGDEFIVNSANTSNNAVMYDEINDKVIFAYRNAGNSNYGTARIGTVSGDTISFGDAVVFNAGNTYYSSISVDVDNNKAVISYSDNSNGSRGTSIVGTVSGDTISFGTEVVFNPAGYTGTISSFYDTVNNKIVISYWSDPDNGDGMSIVGTVSGDSISFGTPAVYNVGYTDGVSSTFIPSLGKFVVIYYDNEQGNEGTAVVGTVNGDTITFGEEFIFNNTTTETGVVINIPNTNKIIISYQNTTNSSYGTVIVGTINDNVITFGSPQIFNSAYTTGLASVYDTTTNKILTSCAGNEVFMYSLTSNVSNMIGISTQDIANGGIGVITTNSYINSSQTGLTPATKYYVDIFGNIVTSSADKKLGLAISSTEILVQITLL